jgi:hypothetical protein
MGDVLALLRRHGMELLEMFQDDSSGSDEIVSHTFFARGGDSRRPQAVGRGAAIRRS